MENFHVKILELVEAGKLVQGQMSNLDIQHDDWCDRLNGVGPCNCDPEIVVYPAADVGDLVSTYFALRNSYRKH